MRSSPRVMKIFSTLVHPATSQKFQFVNLTTEVKKFVSQTELQNGSVLVYTKHTTSSIVITEDETGLQQDIIDFVSETMGANRYYRHDDINFRTDLSPEERKNGSTHLQSLFLGTSQTIPVIDGELTLGKWQSIFFLDFDGPHETRDVIIQIIGE